MSLYFNLEEDGAGQHAEGVRLWRSLEGEGADGFDDAGERRVGAAEMGCGELRMGDGSILLSRDCQAYATDSGGEPLFSLGTVASAKAQRRYRLRP